MVDKITEWLAKTAWARWALSTFIVVTVPTLICEFPELFAKFIAVGIGLFVFGLVVLIVYYMITSELNRKHGRGDQCE